MLNVMGIILLFFFFEDLVFFGILRGGGRAPSAPPGHTPEFLCNTQSSETPHKVAKITYSAG